MRGPHRHQHDAAAQLLIRLNTVHPWSLLSSLLERLRHSSQLSKMVGICKLVGRGRVEMMYIVVCACVFLSIDMFQMRGIYM